MPQDTAGPEGAAKALADSKKLMEGWKKGPMGTKSGHLGAATPPKPSYVDARNQRAATSAAPLAPTKPAAPPAAPPKEFLGVRSDEGPELNTALKEREDFKTENNKQQ